MSVKITSSVYQTIAVSGSEFAVLLAVADCANDQGDNIRPSVEYLAWKANASVRTVQNVIDKWITSRALVPTGAWDIKAEERRPLNLTDDGKPKGGRGIVTIYRLDLSKFEHKKSWEELRGIPKRKGAKVSPFVEPELTPADEAKGATSDEKGCNLEQERVQNTPIFGSHNTKEVPGEEPSGEPGDSLSRKKRTTKAGNRRQDFIDSLKKYHEHKNPELKFEPTPADFKNLDSMLHSKRSMTLQQFQTYLNNRAKSEAVNHAEPFGMWINKIEKYATGPLTRHGQPMGEITNAATYRPGTAEKDSTIRANCAVALQSRADRRMASGEDRSVAVAVS